MKNSFFNKLIFLPLDIPNPPNVCDFWNTLDDKDLMKDEYRTCHHVPIMDANGVYTEIGLQTPNLISWLEEHVFTWAEKTRIMIIKTEPGKQNAPHIDCSPQKFGTLQHKLRYVFQGKVDSLYFIHDNTQTRPKEIDAPYIMSGRWPHAMNNYNNKIKYTLAIGSPWEPNPLDEKYFNILKKSYDKYKHYYIDYQNWQLPQNWKTLFEDRYIVDDKVSFVE